MDDETSREAPPAYAGQSVKPEIQFKIRNARFRSTFKTHNGPQVSDYREQLECMKDSFSEYTRNVGAQQSPSEDAHMLSVEYSQAFGDVANLICEYQACLLKIEPLHEEDVLILLLSRYAKSSGAGVYLEIRRPGKVQVYDSDIPEPDHTVRMQDHLAYGSGVLNARFPLPGRVITGSGYMPIPQTPPSTLIESAITVNFPSIELVSPAYTLPAIETVGDPPAYSKRPRKADINASVTNWGVLPGKLQPPVFRVHRCHHAGVEQAGEGEAFELPTGFPEAVQHVCEIPERYYHVGFHIGSLSHLSYPLVEGGVQSFKCYVVPLDIWIYITVERTGNQLAYNCYKDREVWIACHVGHTECTGCS